MRTEWNTKALWLTGWLQSYRWCEKKKQIQQNLNETKKAKLFCYALNLENHTSNQMQKNGKKQRIKTDGNKLLGDKNKKKWLKFDWICEILHSKDFFSLLFEAVRMILKIRGCECE